MREANARAWEGRGMRRSAIADPTVSHSTAGLLGAWPAVPWSQFGRGQSSRYGHEEPAESDFFRGA